MHAENVHGFQTIIEFHQPLNSHKYCYSKVKLILKVSMVSKCMQKLDKIMINIVRCVSHNWKLTEKCN